MPPAWLEKFIVREDATPDPRRSEEKPALEMHYTALVNHRRILGLKGDTKPRYEVTRRAILQVWGDKCYVTSPINGDKEIATIDFHNFPPKTEIQFLQRGYQVDIKASKGYYEASGGLGHLHWKATGMVAYGRASWELRDETSLVMSVTIDDQQVNGVISLWKNGLDPETEEELVLVGLSKIEEYRKLMRKAKSSAVGAATSGTWLGIAQV